MAKRGGGGGGAAPCEVGHAAVLAVHDKLRHDATPKASDISVQAVDVICRDSMVPDDVVTSAFARLGVSRPFEKLDQTVSRDSMFVTLCSHVPPRTGTGLLGAHLLFAPSSLDTRARTHTHAHTHTSATNTTTTTTTTTTIARAPCRRCALFRAGGGLVCLVFTTAPCHTNPAFPRRRQT